MKIVKGEEVFKVIKGNDCILESLHNKPIIYVGKGKENVDMYRGNFKIEDYVTERIPLLIKNISKSNFGTTVQFGDCVYMDIHEFEEGVELEFTCSDPEINRFWIRVEASKDEYIFGCGEQMSYFNLRGRNFPIWTSEPGVGRDKSTYITWRSDVENKAGGDYYNTNYPQPTFISSKHYYLHVDSTAYSDFNFKNKDFHEICIWEVPKKIRIEAADTFIKLLEKESAYFGRQEELPDWIYNGLIFGVQGGNERVFNLMEKVLDRGVKLSAIWCQDWCGRRVTSFGKRLQWDWHCHDKMYKGLPEKIEVLHKRGIKFMGYVNPYLVKDGELYKEGLEKNYFAKRSDGSVYLVDFGEFYCSVVDFTNPKAFEWFKNDVIIKHSINIGMDGWMADFGEYLPTDDICLFNNKSPMTEHNHWPLLWAKCNYEALRDTNNLSKILYFMRAGGTGSQKYCTLLWAGDQSVDFSRHDGIGTVIVAALSAGICGMGLTHSDIGGYTSLFGNIRTKELFLRWAEMCVFSMVMRTHEGNRPDENYQFYDDEDGIAQMARLTDIYTMLKPYLKELSHINALTGIPAQRPLFIHYEDDKNCYDEQSEYLLGEELLAAPVIMEGVNERKLYLPKDRWIHIWSGKEYVPGVNVVEAPIGYPPVFYKKEGKHETLFREITDKYGFAK